MQILLNGAPITDVTPGGSPVYVPGFEMVPSERQNAVHGMPGRMLQVRADGVDIGNGNPAVLDLVLDPASILVTRGVGENSHVATIRSFVSFLYFTSWLYPIDSDENKLTESSIPVSGNLIVWPIELVREGAVTPQSGTLTLILNQYTLQLAETVKESAVTPQSGTLVIILNQYTLQLAETIKETAVTPQSGTLDVILVSYTLQLAETVKESAVTPQSGTLA